MMKRKLFVCLIVFASWLPLFSAEPRVERYALVLADAPLAQLHSRHELKSFAAAGHRQFAFWLAGFFGNKVIWRGRQYQLGRDGRIALIG